MNKTLLCFSFMLPVFANTASASGITTGRSDCDDMIKSIVNAAIGGDPSTIDSIVLMSVETNRTTDIRMSPVTKQQVVFGNASGVRLGVANIEFSSGMCELKFLKMDSQA